MSGGINCRAAAYLNQRMEPMALRATAHPPTRYAMENFNRER
jgi:hypothetical protein